MLKKNRKKQSSRKKNLQDRKLKNLRFRLKLTRKLKESDVSRSVKLTQSKQNTLQKQKV